MKLWKQTALLAVLALAVAGCAGTPSRQPGPDPAAEQPPRSEAPVPAPPDPGKQPDPAPTPATLTERLLALPAPTLQPTYRWPKPAKGMSYQPLPNGHLLVWPSTVDQTMDSTPFVLTARNTRGEVVWELTLGRPSAEVRGVDVDPRGRTALISMFGGEVHVVDLDRGEIQLTRKVTDGADTMLTGDGNFIAVKRRTPSGGIPWTMGVRSATSENGPVYGAEGTVVHASPYHEYVFGIADDTGGLERKSPRGRVNVFDVDGDILHWNPDMDTTADGRTIYLQRGTQLVVLASDGSRLFQLDDSAYLDTHFAPLSGHFWNELESGQIDIYTNTGAKSTLQINPKQVELWRVLPGGEGLFEIPPNKAYCVVQPDGTIVGCFPFVSADKAGSSGKTFFWVTEPGGTIAAYNGK